MVSSKVVKMLKIVCCIIAVLCAVTLLIEDIFLIKQINDGTLSSKFTDVPEEAQKGVAIAGSLIMTFAIMPLVLLNCGYVLFDLIIFIMLFVSVLKKQNSDTQIYACAITAILSAVNNILLIIVLLEFTYSLLYIASIFCIILSTVLAVLTLIYKRKLKSLKSVEGLNNV